MGKREREMVWRILEGWGPKVNALTKRKSKEIFTAAPDESLQFSFIPSIEHIREPGTEK